MTSNFTSKTVGKIVSLSAVAIGALTLQACTAASTLTSTYGAAAPVPINYRGSTDTERGLYNSQRLRASRGALEQIDYNFVYAARDDDGVSIPAFDYTKMNSKYLRQQVRYFGPEAAGSIVIDANRKHLYYIQPGGKAMRYGIAVGKEGYGWTGNSTIQWKQKWPTWTPPKEMIERQPELQKYADGLEGSPNNPLGARAMYLFKNGKDTMYRIHGTTKPFSIGKAASSGCFRMINQDVMDLYDRVERKSRVMVQPKVNLALVETSNDGR